LSKEQSVITDAATDLKYSITRPNSAEYERCRDVC